VPPWRPAATAPSNPRRRPTLSPGASGRRKPHRSWRWPGFAQPRPYGGGEVVGGGVGAGGGRNLGKPAFYISSRASFKHIIFRSIELVQISQSQIYIFCGIFAFHKHLKFPFTQISANFLYYIVLTEKIPVLDKFRTGLSLVTPNGLVTLRESTACRRPSYVPTTKYRSRRHRSFRSAVIRIAVDVKLAVGTGRRCRWLPSAQFWPSAQDQSGRRHNTPSA
jgi:hypothetical protein